MRELKKGRKRQILKIEKGQIMLKYKTRGWGGGRGVARRPCPTYASGAPGKGDDSLVTGIIPWLRASFPGYGHHSLVKMAVPWLRWEHSLVTGIIP